MTMRAVPQGRCPARPEPSIDPDHNPSVREDPPLPGAQAGTPAECQEKCTELACLAFVRVGSSGVCSFLGNLTAMVPESFGRDCFIPSPADARDPK